MKLELQELWRLTRSHGPVDEGGPTRGTAGPWLDQTMRWRGAVNEQAGEREVQSGGTVCVCSSPARCRSRGGRRWREDRRGLRRGRSGRAASLPNDGSGRERAWTAASGDAGVQQPKEDGVAAGASSGSAPAPGAPPSIA